MSTQKGNVHRQRAQKHQNDFKFKHNKGSKKTEKLKQAPLDLLCKRCYEILKWRIEYRKYKPITTPHKCNQCSMKTIVKAYRTICDACAKRDKKCSKCTESVLEQGGYQEVMSG